MRKTIPHCERVRGEGVRKGGLESGERAGRRERRSPAVDEV